MARVYTRFLYIDGFAGPGEYDGGEDGSPIIVLKVALQHKLKKKFQLPGKELVFIFIEKDEAKYQNLLKRLNIIQLPSNFGVDPFCASFEAMEGRDDALCASAVEVMWRWKIPSGKTARQGRTFFSTVFCNRLLKNRKWISKG